MNTFRLLALTALALQCSAHLLPGTPEPQIEDGITGDLAPWENDGITGSLAPWENDKATPLPPEPWDIKHFEFLNPEKAPEGEEDPNRCRCGQKKAGTRIINGKETEPVEYPWQAGLVWSGGSRTWCGGSLINSNWVLSAAHCTVGKSASWVQVLLAEHDVTVSESHVERYSLKQIINHPSYGTWPWTNGHDISLLELNGRVNFETSMARPICLPSGDSDYVGAAAIVTGFGRIGYNETQSNYLQEVNIEVISNAHCSTIYGGSEASYNTMICAGKSDGTGGCLGDSGGPLITKENNYHVQIGVVSFGSTLCNSFGVFARVTDFKDWINSYTNSGNPDTCSP